MRTPVLIAIVIISILSMLVASMPCQAAGLRLVGPVGRIVPGQDFSVDVVADNVPAEGLGTVQFRLQVLAAGVLVSGAADIGQGAPDAVTVSMPLLISLSTASRSGLGDFFWNGRGANGILVMDNQPLVNGSALFTFAHTSGAMLPSGSGTLARFRVRAGTNVKADKVDFSLSDVMLLAGGTSHTIDSVAGTTVAFGCQATVPSLLGLSRGAAGAALTAANLTLGSVTELDNATGSYPLNVVLLQSASNGSLLECRAPINLTINTPPLDVTALSVSDKLHDNSGTLVIAWTSSTSPDVAGYRIYKGSMKVADLANPAASGTEVTSLVNGVSQQLKVTAYDSFGNESTGVSATGTPINDLGPTVAINPVTTPVKTTSQTIKGTTEAGTVVSVVTDTAASDGTATVTGTTWSYTITGLVEGPNGITVTAIDAAGNTATATSSIVLDTTPPNLTISSLLNGAWTNNQTLNIAGKVTDSGGVKELTINGALIPFDQDGAFSHAYTLQTGVNTITSVAADVLENQVTETRTITYDPTAPVLTINAPPDNSRTNKSFIDVTGTIDENASVEVKVNSNDPDLAAITDKTFTYTANLAVGPNTIQVTATDQAKNSTTAKRSVVHDNLSPSLAITDPPQDITTTQNKIILKGTVADALTDVSVVISVDGVTFNPPVVNGTYEQQISFTTEKTYAITVTATDEALNSTSVQRNVIYHVPGWENASGLASLTKSGTLYDSLNISYYVNFSVKNIGSIPLNGPIRLVIISPSIPIKTLPTLGLKPSSTSGSETYFEIIPAGGSLAPGATLSNQRVNFNMVRVPLTFGMRVDQLR